ncbi:uncharacterized protein E0L32_005440 [Thyridium curvatum]|uniref:Uncharacterized protein n=1 Tax=Thyridium curvatum TaxID=1093900 RepID=A0A507B5V0_9PEZI|nr:uncharacterized protein E0L32_005440 [Thyridium curvatum]TPX14476.1 hypothetical protein E0L32_005440 [Thyridium curvatum]
MPCLEKIGIVDLKPAILASQSWGQMAFEKLAAASTADIDAVIRFAEDIPPPTEPVLDYITEVDTRRALFDDFRALLPTWDQGVCGGIRHLYGRPCLGTSELSTHPHNPVLFAGVIACVEEGIRSDPVGY